jgi:hypothetical protein
MSLYRQAGRRSGWLLAAGVVALLVGFGIGFAVAQAVSDDPTFEDAVADVQAEAATTADAFELVALHYESSPEGARDQLARAQELFAEGEPDLRLLAPAEAAAAAQALQRVESLVDESASAAQVEEAAEAARAAGRRAARLR